jgi:hypothetical protein
MTPSADDVRRAGDLLSCGLSHVDVARKTGIPRSPVREWAAAGIGDVLVSRTRFRHSDDGLVPCQRVRDVPEESYAYLLGLYLGDGCISAQREGMYRLRISLDLRYPTIIDECEAAMARVLPNKVGRVSAPGCVSVNAYSRHWVCLFPQHAPGQKHLRPIELAPWQERISLETHPKLLLRGLIHSDGYRGLNRIKGGYAYPRYLFSNRSGDIRSLFTEACHRVGVHARQSGRWHVSVARRTDVELLDTFIGPKR